MRSRLVAGLTSAASFAALLGVSAVPAGAAGFVHAPGSPFASAGATGSLALGDLNGDGKLDAVVADPASGSLTVLPGNGRGALGPATAAPAASGGTRPSALALADLNADGRLDVAVANDGSRNVSALLGDGAGGLTAAPRSPFGTNGTRPASLAVGDFNGDTRPDVAVVHLSSGDVSVMLGDGAGGLARAPGAPVATGGFHPGPAAAGDFNGDGRLDLAVGNESGNVSIMRGDGTGRLTRSGASPFGLSPAAIGAGDLNGDGRLDVAVANTTGTVSILLGNGAGSLTPLPATAPVVTVGSAPSALAIADLDRDGRLDLAVANAGGEISVLLGDGAAGFAPAPATPVSSGGGSPSSLASGDLNGDGKPDLVVVNGVSASVSVLLNGVVPPPAGFVAFPVSPVAGEQVTFAYSSPGAIASLDWDLNGDGSFDDANGPTASRAFAVPGTYLVGLRVIDLDGVGSTSARTIVVSAPAAGPVPAPAAAAAASYPQLMAPFPIVRVTGRTGRRGARIKGLAVLAPAGAKISVRCRGKGCPFRRWRQTVAPGGIAGGSRKLTVRALRGRFLRAGATLEVRVYKSRVIGKYTKLVIRRRKPPVRSDLCLPPGSSAASRCPAT